MEVQQNDKRKAFSGSWLSIKPFSIDVLGSSSSMQSFMRVFTYVYVLGGFQVMHTMFVRQRHPSMLVLDVMDQQTFDELCCDDRSRSGVEGLTGT